MENAEGDVAHDDLVEGVSSCLKHYGFYIEKKVKVPSTLFESTVFTSKSDIDIYCHIRPFGEDVRKGKRNADIFASDFIIECKTTNNLNQKDKEKLIEKARFLPTYICTPIEKHQERSSTDVKFFTDNRIGILTYEKELNRIIVYHPASIELKIDAPYPLRQKIFFHQHQLFQMFKFDSKQSTLCLPSDLFLGGGEAIYCHYFSEIDDEETIEHLIGLRNKVMAELEKEGYRFRECWAVFSQNQTRETVYQGFDIQSLEYALESLFHTYAKFEKRKERESLKINLKESEPDWFKPGWNNEEFVFCICAERGWDQVLFMANGNVQYYGLNLRIRFHQPAIYSTDMFGAEIQKQLGIKKVSRYSDAYYKEKVIRGDQNMSIKNEKLEYIQALDEKFDAMDPGSLKPVYYFYNGNKGKFVVTLYDRSNFRIWMKESFDIETRRFVRNHNLNGIELQSPWSYEETLDQ